MSEGSISRRRPPGEFKHADLGSGSEQLAAAARDLPQATPQISETDDAKHKDNINELNKPHKLVEEETRARDGIKKEVYQMYLGLIGYPVAICVIAAPIAYKGTDLAEKNWLAFWGASYSSPQQSLIALCLAAAAAL